MRNFEETTKDQSDTKIFRRLLAYANPYKKNFIISMILILVDVILSSAAPAILGIAVWVINNSMATNEKFLLLAIVVIAFVTSIAIAVIITYFQNMLLQTAGQKIVKNIRVEVFEHIESLS